MRTFALSVCVVALLAAHAGRAAEPERSGPVAEALNALSDCMTDAIIRLDDGQSDAAFVGEAANGACRHESDKAKLESGKSASTPEDRRQLDAYLERSWRQAATGLVLEYRRRLQESGLRQ